MRHAHKFAMARMRTIEELTNDTLTYQTMENALVHPDPLIGFISL